MKRLMVFFLGLVILFTTTGAVIPKPVVQELNPAPPTSAVRLIFIHHSTGENWLNDNNGGLGRALQQYNYYPSDTNYGWGPDAIGDRTDIPNWLEWFRSDQTSTIMQAVYTENEVHSPFERTLADPSGENQIVMFKSCFPNSALDGNPNDPPTPGTDLNVRNAKYVYNEILKYFKTRPDRLFVVITAPPLSDGTHAANARAFNNWLVNDWLKENNYTQPNVAVFDFYNILTGPDNHHSYVNDRIEHRIANDRNTSYYPSEDDHPNQAGNKKATQDFIPMLNIFYNRWQASGPIQAEVAPAEPAPAVEQAQEAAEPAPSMVIAEGMLFDFESDQPVWDANVDEAVAGTALDCQPVPGIASGGTRSMQITFNVAPESWATCSSFFSSPTNLSSADGIQFMLQVDQPGNVLHLDVFIDIDGERATYARDIPFTSAGGDWVTVQTRWSDLKRVEWEADGGSPFTHPDQITGIAFGFPAGDTVDRGVIHVDDIRTFSGSQSAEPPSDAQPAAAARDEASDQEQSEKPPTQSGNQKRGLLPFCGSALLIPFGTLTFLRRRKISMF